MHWLCANGAPRRRGGGGGDQMKCWEGHSAGLNSAMFRLDQRWLCGELLRLTTYRMESGCGPVDFLPFENPDAQPLSFLLRALRSRSDPVRDGVWAAYIPCAALEDQLVTRSVIRIQLAASCNRPAYR